jgi:SAM-dependent methyltransferase
MPKSEPGPPSAPSVFERYGRYYDILYRDKSYEGECDAVEAAFAREAGGHVRSILDVGCGTGGHAIPFARRGYDVEGIDLSSVMLRDAAAKAERAGVRVRWHAADMRSFRLNRRFDVVLCLFAALGYLCETRDVLDALATFRTHLDATGLLILDVWNGLAVARVGPSARVKRATDGSIRVVRSVCPDVNFERHVCRNFYHLLVLDDRSLVEEVEEIHDMRFFFPRELVHYLDETGFEVLRVAAFPNLTRALEPTDWSMGVIAKVRA